MLILIVSVHIKIHYYVLFLVDDYEIKKEITTLEIKITDSLPPKIEGVKPIIGSG